MQLQFDKLEIENFAMITERVVIDFSRHPGLCFVRGVNKYRPRLGANECGKSTLFAAMCWALFGRTVDNQHGTDIKPWRNGGTTAVTVRLRTDQDKHEIKRTANPNKLTLDGDVAGQEQIDRLLSLEFKVFIQTILLGQGQPLFFDLKPREKMQLFSDVLDLDRWTSRSEYAAKRSADLERDATALDGRIESYKLTLDNLDGMLEDNEKRSQEWEQTRQEDENEAKDQIAKDKERQQKLQAVVDKAELAYDGALTELRAINKQTEDARLLHSGTEISRDQSERIIFSLRKEIGNIGDTCPTCGQSLKGTALQKHRETTRKKIAEEKQRLEKLERAVSNDAAAVKKLQQQHESFQKKADNFGSELRIQRPEIAELKGRIAAVEAILKKARNEGNPYRAQTKTMHREVEKTEAALDSAENEKQKLQNRIERTKFWIKGFKDVQLYLIEDALEELQIITNAMLPDVGLDDDWEIRYAIERETLSGSVQRGLNVNIISPDNKAPVRWECWSGGVKQRLRVVGALALSEVLLSRAGVTPDLEILDEPTRSLSSEGSQDLCQFLADRAQQLGRRIMYIDHLAIESDAFSSVLTVTRGKDRKVSTRLSG
jgi:DNA repair exonuclease SbcCD ATPase subunit